MSLTAVYPLLSHPLNTRVLSGRTPGHRAFHLSSDPKNLALSLPCDESHPILGPCFPYPACSSHHPHCGTPLPLFPPLLRILLVLHLRPPHPSPQCRDGRQSGTCSLAEFSRPRGCDRCSAHTPPPASASSPPALGTPTRTPCERRGVGRKAPRLSRAGLAPSRWRRAMCKNAAAVPGVVSRPDHSQGRYYAHALSRRREVTRA
jgi:hypothetical protein